MLKNLPDQCYKVPQRGMKVWGHVCSRMKLSINISLARHVLEPIFESWMKS